MKIPGHSVYKVLMGQMGDSICAGESEARPVFTSVQEQRLVIAGTLQTEPAAGQHLGGFLYDQPLPVQGGAI
jgi:hypothetical protein